MFLIVIPWLEDHHTNMLCCTNPFHNVLFMLMNGKALGRSHYVGSKLQNPFQNCPWDGIALVEDGGRTALAAASVGFGSKSGIGADQLFDGA
jgi:hypothetical protein